MPTYEYACSGCGNAWEEMQKITEAPLTECPKCHQATAKRQISGGNFILKGGGWYADLYSSSKGGGSKSESSGSSTSSTSADTTAATKTETKSESTASPAPAASKSAAE
jgi:putative FmdB family regulatory protein